MRTVISDCLTSRLQCQEVSVLLLIKFGALFFNGRQYLLCNNRQAESEELYPGSNEDAKIHFLKSKLGKYKGGVGE